MAALDEAGTDHTLRFAVENWWVTDHESYRTATPSAYNIEALAARAVITWTKENWDELLGVIPALKTFCKALRARSYEVNQRAWCFSLV